MANLLPDIVGTVTVQIRKTSSVLYAACVGTETTEVEITSRNFAFALRAEVGPTDATWRLRIGAEV